MAASIVTSPASRSTSLDPIFFQFQTTLVDGSGAPTVDNLSNFVEIWQEPDGDAAAKIVSLTHAYGTDKRTYVDAHAALNLKPHLPTPATITPDATVATGIAKNAFRKFYLKYADRYGSPPTPETLATSANFYAIFGSLGLDTTGAFFNQAQIIKCHNHVRPDKSLFWKPISHDQPDWAYFYMKSDRNLSAEVLVTYFDGTTSTFTALAAADYAVDKLYWIEAGFRQLQVDTNLAVGKTEADVYRYELRLRTTSLVLATFRYQLDCPCHPWNKYLLLSNGLGGCESVWLKGITSLGYEGERHSLERPRWVGANPQDGLMANYAAQGQHTYEANTGWHSIHYIRHLRQLLLGDIWLIDTQNNRFLKMMADTTSFKLEEDDQQLFSLEFKFKAAWKDQAFNSF